MKQHVLPDGEVEQEVTPREARQGRPGVPVLYVLIGGLCLAGIVFLVLYFGAHSADIGPDATKGAAIEWTIPSRAPQRAA